MTLVRGFGQLLGVLVEMGLNRWKPPGVRHGWDAPRHDYEQQD